MKSALRFAAFFYKDLQWKVLALTLAFVLWFVGTNVNNPVQTVSYDNLPLNVLGRDLLAQNNLVLLNEQQVNNTRINVSIRATRSNHALINAARSDNIQASINLSTINFEQVLESDGISYIPVDINIFIHQEYTMSLPTPNIVELQLDHNEERLIAIDVDVIGEPSEGFASLPYNHTPRVVRLSGARSILRNVSDVRARVYIIDAFETVEEPRTLMVYDGNEDITNRVNLSVQATNVIVPIFPYADIALRVDVPQGAVRPGFMATEVNIEPARVTVVGNAEIIDGTDFINLGSVDSSMADANIEQTFDIRQALTGTGLTLRADAPTEATATIIVERVIDRNMFLPLEDLTVTGYGDREFVFAEEGPVILTIRGRESVINALTLGQIGASVDLTGLGAGTHTVQVDVVPPPRASLANLATVDITIEPEPIVFEPEEPPDWAAELEDEEDEGQ